MSKGSLQTKGFRPEWYQGFLTRSKVSDQNGVSLHRYIVEIHHSGRKPLKYNTSNEAWWETFEQFLFLLLCCSMSSTVKKLTSTHKMPDMILFHLFDKKKELLLSNNREHVLIHNANSKQLYSIEKNRKHKMNSNDMSLLGLCPCLHSSTFS